VMRREGDRLIIEPVHRSSLLELLASWEKLDEEFPNVDERLLPLRDVRL
jgi:antitoxin VapB